MQFSYVLAAVVLAFTAVEGTAIANPDVLFEEALHSKRLAETTPANLAARWCQDGASCNVARAAEAIADAMANPVALPTADAFAEAYCSAAKRDASCNLKRAAEAIPEAYAEAWCQHPPGHGAPCTGNMMRKRAIILHREYNGMLALRSLTN